MSDALKAYYDKAGVDAIRDNIINNFDNYYNKSTVDNKVKAVDDKVNTTNATVASNKTLAANELATTKEVLHGEVLDVDNTNVMSKAQFEANATARRERYAGSGFIDGFDLSKRFGKWKRDPASKSDFLIAGSFLTTFPKNHLLIPTCNHNVNVSVNGELVHLYSGNGMFFADLPGINVPNVITDSTDASVMKQGDMAVLKDLNRDFSSVVDKYSFYVEGAATATKNDDGTYTYNRHDETRHHAWYIIHPSSRDFIKGVKYSVSFDIGDYTGRINMVYLQNKVKNGSKISGFIIGGNRGSATGLYINGVGKDTDIIISDIIIKQVSETPIVALQDTDAGDLYENAGKFAVRNSISRQDLVFLELTTRYAA